MKTNLAITNISGRRRPADITVFSVFFMFCALVCALAAIALLFPDAGVSPVLGLMQAFQEGDVDLFWLALVGVTCILAACGIWRCSYWGFLVASLVLCFVVIADFLRALFTQHWWALVANLIFGALILLYLRARANVFRS